MRGTILADSSRAFDASVADDACLERACSSAASRYECYREPSSQDKNLDLQEWLSRLGLSRYFDRLVLLGYDDMCIMRSINVDEATELPNLCGMPRGHARQFQRGLAQLRGGAARVHDGGDTPIASESEHRLMTPLPDSIIGFPDDEDTEAVAGTTTTIVHQPGPCVSATSSIIVDRSLDCAGGNCAKAAVCLLPTVACMAFHPFGMLPTVCYLLSVCYLFPRVQSTCFPRQPCVEACGAQAGSVHRNISSLAIDSEGIRLHDTSEAIIRVRPTGSVASSSSSGFGLDENSSIYPSLQAPCFEEELFEEVVADEGLGLAVSTSSISGSFRCRDVPRMKEVGHGRYFGLPDRPHALESCLDGGHSAPRIVLRVQLGTLEFCKHELGVSCASGFTHFRVQVQPGGETAPVEWIEELSSLPRTVLRCPITEDAEQIGAPLRCEFDETLVCPWSSRRRPPSGRCHHDEDQAETNQDRGDLRPEDGDAALLAVDVLAELSPEQRETQLRNGILDDGDVNGLRKARLWIARGLVTVPSDSTVDHPITCAMEIPACMEVDSSYGGPRPCSLRLSVTWSTSQWLEDPSSPAKGKALLSL